MKEEKFTIKVPKLIWDVYIDGLTSTGDEPVDLMRARLSDYTAWLSERGYDFSAPAKAKKPRKPRKERMPKGATPCTFEEAGMEAPKKRGRKAKGLPPGAVPAGGEARKCDI